MSEFGGNAIVAFYHDIEQAFDSDANPQRCRDVVKQFLALEKKYGVHTTYNVVGKIFVEQPDLIESITQDGHEIAFHSYDHRPDWNASHSGDQIDLCRTLSDSIRGYRSPRSEIDAAAIERLWQKGFLWNAEADPRPEPYFIHKGLVRLPIAADDWPLHLGHMSAAQYLQHISELLRRRRFVAVGSHDSVTSQAPEERLQVWEGLLQSAARAQAVSVTCSEAADLFRRAAVTRYYTQTATSWNRETKSLYRTRRFQEMIRAEAEKLQKPVIADLGSGGGVLSASTKDLAQMIYCVDNAPGMVAEVGSGVKIQGRLGEATDSGLPEHSADLVICARIIEYLFWPERLADEIKRVGKIGGTYLVTFPAFRGTPPLNEGTPPDRIRRYFTPEEIRDWARRIGPGRLLGVQYETAEPPDNETEQRYRAVEEKPGATAVPTNWVCIGTIEAHDVFARNRTLPTSVAAFRFPDERSGRIQRVLKRLTSLLPRPMRSLGRRVLGRL